MYKVKAGTPVEIGPYKFYEEREQSSLTNDIEFDSPNYYYMSKTTSQPVYVFVYQSITYHILAELIESDTNKLNLMSGQTTNNTL